MTLAIVQETYKASGALAAVVGDRISQTIAPEDQTRPYLVWFVVTSVPDNTLSELPLRDDMRIQTDVYSKSGPQAYAAMVAARDAAESIGHIVFGPWNTFEEQTKLHRWSFDLELWNPR